MFHKKNFTQFSCFQSHPHPNFQCYHQFLSFSRCCWVCQVTSQLFLLPVQDSHFSGFLGHLLLSCVQILLLLSYILLYLSFHVSILKTFLIVSLELWKRTKGRSYISRFKLPTEVRILCSSKKIVQLLIFKKQNYIPILHIEHFGDREVKSSSKMTELGGAVAQYICAEGKNNAVTLCSQHIPDISYFILTTPSFAVDLQECHSQAINASASF